MITEDPQENYRKGYIRVFRSIKDKGYYKNSKYVHLWIHLLLKAGHTEREFLFNNKIHKLKPGQLITGRNELSLETGIPGSTIEKILECFEKEGQLGQKKNSRFRLISILSWEAYQGGGQRGNIQKDPKVDLSGKSRTEVGQQRDSRDEVIPSDSDSLKVESGQKSDNKGTASGHLADTNNKDNNVKNLNKEILLSDFQPDVGAPVYERMAKWMHSEFSTIHPNHKALKKSKLSAWTGELRFMVEQDGRTEEEIVKYFKFLLQDKRFWRNTIYSAEAYRRSFDNIVGGYKKMEAEALKEEKPIKIKTNLTS